MLRLRQPSRRLHIRDRPVHVVHVVDRVVIEQDFLLSVLFQQYSMLVFHTSTTDAI